MGLRFGTGARRAFLADLVAERYRVASLAAEDYGDVIGLEARYGAGARAGVTRGVEPAHRHTPPPPT